MSIDFTLNANVRNDQGKGASRRLRRNADQVPAIVYGAKKEPENVVLAHKDVAKALENEAFYTHIISLIIGDKKQEVLIKAVQRHPARPIIMHIDFLRVDKNQKVTLRIPLHFIHQDICAGVKAGGVVNHSMSDLEIRCFPGDLPEYIEVDVANLELGQIVHISDLKLPKGVESTQLAHGASHNLAVATVTMPKIEKVETPVAEAAAATPEAGAAAPAAADAAAGKDKEKEKEKGKK